MPYDLHWLDIIIALFLLISLIQGIKSGLVKSIFSIAGIAVGIGVAIAYYVEGSNQILKIIDLPAFIADSVSFILLFSITAILIHILGSLVAVATVFSPVKLLDKIGGGGVGVLIGVGIVGIFLILLIAFPVFGGVIDYVDQSTFAPYIISNTEFMIEAISTILPVDLPSLTLHPEELAGFFNNSVIENEIHYHDIDFASLESTACFVCDGEVEFLGFLENGRGSHSPKFVCTECGRTSDGCQTYEGYHLMYEQCPVELGNRGYRFDCGIWTNHSYHRPTGPCLYCGAE